MISEKQIRKGFRKHLLSLGYIDVDTDGQWTNVSVENRNFTPPKDSNGNDVPFFRLTKIPSFRRQISSGYSRTQGIMQLDFFVPANEGAYQAEEMADQIMNNFINVVLEGGIRIWRTQTRAADQQPDYFMIPIELYYRFTDQT